MSTLRKFAAVAVAVACSVPLAAGNAAAQNPRDKTAKVSLGTQDAQPESGLEIVEVRIYARNPETGEDLAWVNPGDTLILPPRTEVRLRMEARPRSKGPRYPSASYAVTEAKPVAGIMNANVDMGSATLQTYGRTGRSTLYYEVLDNSLTLRDLRRGSIVVSVENTAEVPAEPQAQATADESLIEALYRGILLRDPEPAAVQAAAARLQRGGYAEAIAIATQIAASEESRDATTSRGISLEQRLEALYRHLLGYEREAVDEGQWKSDLNWVRAQNVRHVVDAMVRSEAFQERFGFDTRRDARSTRGVRNR